LQAASHWGERAGELILLAMDQTGWLSLVGLTNRGFLAGADRGRPRVDWDLPLVATGGVPFARPEDALTHKFLGAHEMRLACQRRGTSTAARSLRS